MIDRGSFASVLSQYPRLLSINRKFDLAALKFGKSVDRCFFDYLMPGPIRMEFREHAA
jgi:hypothetical protein